MLYSQVKILNMHKERRGHQVLPLVILHQVSTNGVQCFKLLHSTTPLGAFLNHIDVVTTHLYLLYSLFTSFLCFHLIIILVMKILHLIHTCKKKHFKIFFLTQAYKQQTLSKVDTNLAMLSRSFCFSYLSVFSDFTT